MVGLDRCLPLLNIARERGEDRHLINADACRLPFQFPCLISFLSPCYFLLSVPLQLSFILLDFFPKGRGSYGTLPKMIIIIIWGSMRSFIFFQAFPWFPSFSSWWRSFPDVFYDYFLPWSPTFQLSPSDSTLNFVLNLEINFLLLAALKEYSQVSARAMIVYRDLFGQCMEMKSAYIQNVSIEYFLNEFRLLVTFAVEGLFNWCNKSERNVVGFQGSRLDSFLVSNS